jgi:serine/threonine protein kinase
MPGPEKLLADRYRLHALVGSGGMGEVWRATDEVLGRTVAVKVLRPELLAQPGFADRFLTEARTLATIRHPGVVTIHDFQRGDAGTFLVMEYIEGESLAAILRREGRLDPATTMVLVAQVAEALQAAHDRGVVHRDIKPANLLVGNDGVPVLTDFGIARAVDATSLTMPGTVVGTPAYLAPELALGHPATASSDIYSLGVVGYECLAGRRPFEGEISSDAAMRRRREPPPPLPDEVPRAVAAVIDGALAGEPEKRWRSAAEMAARARYAAELVGADNQTTLPRFVPGRAAPPTRPVPPSPPPPVPSPAEAPPPQRAAGAAAAVGAPAAPLPPTRVDSRLARPVGPRPAAPVSPSQAPPAPPSPPAVHWTGPPRPAPVTVAAVLFLVTAVTMLLVAVATLSVLDRAVAVVRATAGPGWAEVVRLVALIESTGVGVAGLGYLAVAASTARGRPAARGWAFALAVPLLCCCLPGWCSLGAGDGGQNGQAQVVAEEVVTAVWVVGGALSLLVALVLVTLPPAGRYFRPPPVVVYYPYQPPR